MTIMTMAEYCEYCAWLGFVRGLQAVCLDLTGYRFELRAGPSVVVVP